MTHTTNNINKMISKLIIATALFIIVPTIASATWGNWSLWGDHSYTSTNCTTNYSHGSKNNGSTNHGSKNNASNDCDTNTHGSKNHGSTNHGSKNHGSKNHGSKNHGSTKHGSKNNASNDCDTNTHGSKNHGSNDCGINTHGSKNHSSTNHGSNNHCSVDCSIYEKKADYYKSLADKNLERYKSTHCYTYYSSYLCFAKKYEYFKNKFDNCNQDVTVDCDKYKKTAEAYKTKALCFKTIADKYLEKYNRYHWSCYKSYYDCYMKKYEAQMALYNSEMDKYTECQNTYNLGSISGYVFYDANEDTVKDINETGTADINLTIEDAAGNVVVATTDNNGYYIQTGLAVGDATVTLDEMTLPNGAILSTVSDANVTVSANTNTEVNNIAYSLPTPVGSISGYIFFDENNNSLMDNNETGTADINLTIEDATGNVVVVTTDNNGYYIQTGLAVGDATVTLDEITLPNGAILTTVNDTNVTVSANTNTEVNNNIGYIFPKQFGSIYGNVYADLNNNGQRDPGEFGIAGIIIHIVDAEDNNLTAITTLNGDYEKSGLVEGVATVTVDVMTLPLENNLSAGENPSTVIVIANESSDAGLDGYTPVSGGDGQW